ncbi:MAG: hypothetical protein PHT59_07050 [Candidatus Omnitrophica bacterium]|nr:hypothetical protein [Candidatus Omnitrophota bacterium]
MTIKKILRYTLFYGTMLGALGVMNSMNNLRHNQHAHEAPPMSADAAKKLTDRQFERKAEIEREIQTILSYTWHQRDFSNGRIRIAQLYIELSGLDAENRNFYLDEALRTAGSAGPDEGFQFHESGQYVRNYFDVRLAVANAHYVAGNYARAVEIYQGILHELGDENVRLAQQVHEYSVPGFTNRANLELAMVYVKQGNYDEADGLFGNVRSWALAEAGESRLELWWKDANVKDLNYLAASASRGLMFTSLIRGNYDAVIANARDILALEASTDEDGFMDIGADAVIHTMIACLENSQSLDEAKSALRRELPWAAINRSDLVDSLGYVNGFPLDDPGFDLWNAVVEGFQYLELNYEQQANVDQIRVYSSLSQP